MKRGKKKAGWGQGLGQQAEVGVVREGPFEELTFEDSRISKKMAFPLRRSSANPQRLILLNL